MKLALVCALVLAVAVIAEASPRLRPAEFETWRKTHGKNYAGDEYLHRARIFADNLGRIEAHNAKGKSYTMALNEFADQTWSEFRLTKLGGTRPWKRAANPVNMHGMFTLPKSVDWREQGAISDVKDQGQCGSCWSFSTTGSVECAHAIYTGELVSLSEQQLVDCSESYGNMGCNGGLMDYGFEYIMDNGALCTEESYPYTAEDGVCDTSSCTSVSDLVTRFVDVAQYDENALKAAVATTAVSVAIEADQMDFQFYSGGVMDGECGTSLDHGVLAVGYGEENGQKYWLVKNSWGASWGDSGYIKLARTETSGGAGQCGIAMQPSYPVVN